MTSVEGMHFFQVRDGQGLFCGLPSNNKSWHERFFFVSGEGWKYPPDEENPVRVQQSWGVLSTQGNASDYLALFLLFVFLCYLFTYCSVR